MQQVLIDLNTQIRDAQETKRRIIGALVYPIVLLLVAVIVIAVMLWFVVPTFAGMFQEMDAELPQITQAVLRASDWIVSYGLYVAAAVVLGVFLLRRALRTETGRRRIQAMLMPLPMVGDLMVQAAMYRFASNLALLLKSGVPMLETLATLSNVFRHDPAYRDAVTHARNRLAAGRALAECAGRIRAVHRHDDQRRGDRREVGPTGPGDAGNRSLLQRENEQLPRQSHEAVGAVHHHGHGRRDRRRDAGDLHSDVRDGGEGALMPKAKTPAARHARGAAGR